MKRDPLPAHVLATRIIPNVAPDMAKELGLTPDQKSLAIVTADSDDVTYTALGRGHQEGRLQGCLRQELLRRRRQRQHQAGRRDHRHPGRSQPR